MVHSPSGRRDRPARWPGHHKRDALRAVGGNEALSLSQQGSSSKAARECEDKAKPQTKMAAKRRSNICLRKMGPPVRNLESTWTTFEGWEPVIIALGRPSWPT